MGTLFLRPYAYRVSIISFTLTIVYMYGFAFSSCFVYGFTVAERVQPVLCVSSYFYLIRVFPYDLPFDTVPTTVYYLLYL